MANHAFAAITAAATLLGLPYNFKRDLTVHDRDTCNRLQDAPFLWAARLNGTHLITLEGRRQTDPAAGVVACVSECFEPCHWFYWNGWSLEACTRLEAGRIAERHDTAANRHTVRAA